MAFYTDNRFANASDDFNIQVEAAAGYDGALGCQFAYIESVQESQDIFETALRNDFEEAYAAHSMNESAVIAIQEGGIRDMWDKIVEFFKNLWKKIKGIFLGFEAKFRSIFVKSNKEFVKKYLPLLRKKDFKDFKVKCDLMTKDAIILQDVSSTEGVSVDIKKVQQEISKPGFEYASDEEKCDTVRMLTNGKIDLSSFKDLKKEFREYHFDGPEVRDDVNVIDICMKLQSSDKDIETTKKSYNNLEKAIKNFIKIINNNIKELDSKETVQISNKYNFDPQNGNSRSVDGFSIT